MDLLSILEPELLPNPIPPEAIDSSTSEAPSHLMDLNIWEPIPQRQGRSEGGLPLALTDYEWEVLVPIASGKV